MDFEVEDSLAESLFGAFSVLVSVFIELLFVESASLFFSLALVVVLVLFDDGLAALSEAGLFIVDAGEVATLGEALAAGVIADIAGDIVGDGFTLALAAGVALAATEAVAAGVMVAAGVALAFVEALVLLVVVGTVVVVPVVPVVEVTPTLKLGVTP